MTTINPLTREQKLLAEIVVQLGNITEAINAASCSSSPPAMQAISRRRPSSSARFGATW